MTFDPNQVSTFLDLFASVSSQIRSVDGCRHLELWQDARFMNIFTTYSIWESNEHLQAYRNSDLFRSTWAQTKTLFAAPPVAHSSYLKDED